MHNLGEVGREETKTKGRKVAPSASLPSGSSHDSEGVPPPTSSPDVPRKSSSSARVPRIRVKRPRDGASKAPSIKKQKVPSHALEIIISSPSEASDPEDMSLIHRWSRRPVPLSMSLQEEEGPSTTTELPTWGEERVSSPLEGLPMLDPPLELTPYISPSLGMEGVEVPMTLFEGVLSLESPDAAIPGTCAQASSLGDVSIPSASGLRPPIPTVTGGSSSPPILVPPLAFLPSVLRLKSLEGVQRLNKVGVQAPFE